MAALILALGMETMRARATAAASGRVVVRVGVAAELGRNGDVAGKLGEERRALGVDSGLLVLGGCPLRVSGHAHLLR